VYEVVRETGKRFRQRRPIGDGGFINNVKGVAKLPYRLPELLIGISNGETVFISEGEKDVERARSQGLCATTISGGAKANRGAMRASLPQGFAQLFIDAKRVVVLGDYDKPGDVFAQVIAEEISAFCPDVRKISPLPGAERPGFDISDWFDAGHSVEELLALVEETPQFHNETSTGEVGGGLAAADDDDDTPRGTPSERLVEILKRDGIDLFHDSGGRSYATYARDGHQETSEISLSRFKSYCQYRYYNLERKPLTASALKEVGDVLSAIALFDGPERATGIRCARDGDTAYLDLANEGWTVVAISPDGYRVISSAECPIRFVRRPDTLPLPNPLSGGTLTTFDRYLPTDPSARVLVKAYLVASLYSGIPLPVLNLTGPQGSGKSTVARRIRALVDPNRSPLRSEPREIRDIAAGVTSNYLCAFDNISRLPDWLSDVFCRLATGGGFAGRRLYTDDEEHVVDAIRPVLITAIENVVFRGDLADRTITVNLHLIDETTRQTETALNEQFEADRPAIFGALLEALSAALLYLPKVDQSDLGRMADFETIGRAASAALGVTPDIFADVCRTWRITASSDVTEASPLTPKLREYANQGWSGTFQQLFSMIVPPDDKERRDGGWPRTPRGLSGALKRLIPDLRVIGIDVRIGEPGRERSRVVALRSIGEGASLDGPTTSATSAMSATSATSPGHRDPELLPVDVVADVPEMAATPTSASRSLIQPGLADVADVADVSSETLEW